MKVTVYNKSFSKVAQ